MKQYFRKSFLVHFLGGSLIVLLWSNHYATDFVKVGLGYVLLVGLLILFLIRLNRYVIKPYPDQQTPTTKPLLPFLLIGIVSTGILVYTYTQQNKAVLFTAYRSIGLTNTTLKFHTDNTWLAQEDAFLGSEFHYGEYQLKGNQLYLANATQVGLLKHSVLQLVTHPDESIELLQVGKEQQVDTTATRFPLTFYQGKRK